MELWTSKTFFEDKKIQKNLVSMYTEFHRWNRQKELEGYEALFVENNSAPSKWWIKNNICFQLQYLYLAIQQKNLRQTQMRIELIRKHMERVDPRPKKSIGFKKFFNIRD